EAVYVSVAHRDLLAMGLNCATGPDFMTDHLRTLAAISRFPVSCFPNAGLPDEEGRYNEPPESLVTKVERFCAEGWVTIIGGCCGLTDMIAFLDVLTRKVKVPLMLDSTDARVLEEALTRCQGKAIINSINLEDGEERFEKVVPLIHRYGAAVVVGCIDEHKQRGMAVTRQR